MRVRELLEKLLKMSLDAEVVVDTEARQFQTHLVDVKDVFEESVIPDGPIKAVLYLEIG